MPEIDNDVYVVVAENDQIIKKRKVFLEKTYGKCKIAKLKFTNY